MSSKDGINCEFWIISAKPKLDNDPIESCKRACQEIASVYKYTIPELRVGTLDTLVGLSDELSKLDTYAESVVKKLATHVKDILNDKQDKIAEMLKIGQHTMEDYLKNFQWDLAKYPIKQPVKNIMEMISKVLSNVESDMKIKTNAYNSVQNNLNAIEKKSNGSLLSRSLNDIVKKDDFINDSEYLITLLVAVSRTSYEDWKNSYETLTTYVVPQSSKLIYEDQEYGLFSVTLFKKEIEEFKKKSREKKFIVRDFRYNENDIINEKKEFTRLSNDKDKLFSILLKWLKVSFSDSFSCWVHIKALRIFVESVLRYGLPVNFQAMIIQPQKKYLKKLREILEEHFMYLDVQNSTMTDGVMLNDSKETTTVDLAQFISLQQDYYTYVYLQMKTNILDH